jgi:nitrous-oxide reductase
VTFKVDKSGVFPYYCTNFCSALHQEMQGYLIVGGRNGRPTTTNP